MIGYGGDFGDFPNNGSFSGNGILFADHTPSAKMQEVKALYAPIRIVPNETGVDILNNNLFENTNGYRFIATQKVRDQIVGQTEFEVRIEPGRHRHIPLNWEQYQGESVLTVSAILKNDQPWAKAGHEVSFGQHVLSRTPPFHAAWQRHEVCAGQRILRCGIRKRPLPVQPEGTCIHEKRRSGMAAGHASTRIRSRLDR